MNTSKLVMEEFFKSRITFCTMTQLIKNDALNYANDIAVWLYDISTKFEDRVKN